MAVTDTKSIRTTARSILIGWANLQDAWVRLVVSEVLETRRPIAEGRIPNFYDLFLREKELRAGDPVTAGELVGEVASEQAEPPLKLTRLRNVHRVNALKPDQEIEFNPRLTIVYGENATGKTGYVRVLKRLASARTAEAILPNVVAPTDQPSAPSATIGYRLADGSEVLHEWSNEAGVYPFTSIDIFDARSVAIHVDDPELVYVYTPGELALFSHVAQALEAIKARLESDQRVAASKGNSFTPRFARESRVYPKIESLGAATDIAELRALGVVTAEEQAGLEGLRERVGALRSPLSEDRLQLVRADQSLYRGALQAIESWMRIDQSAYGRLLAERAASRARHDQVTREAFGPDLIPGVLTETWRRFIESGEAYAHEHVSPDYPQAGNHCIYCQQVLGEAGLALLQKYRAFCNSRAREEIAGIEKRIASQVQEVVRLDLGRIEQEVERRATAYGTGKQLPAALSSTRNLLPNLRALQEAVRTMGALGDPAFAQACSQTKASIEQHLETLQAQSAELSKQAGERKKALEEESAKLRDLEARLILRSLMPEITNFVEQAKWAERAKAHLGRLPALSRSLTQASKAASEDLVNQNFAKLFEEECECLRAPRVRLEFPGRRGQAVRKKALTDDHRLSEILSEGEQKVIALADFLAEVFLRGRSTPVVLDDPVTSLDYRRIEHITDRIVALSRERQVVVFTHNIWFTTQLLSRFENTRDACSFFEIDEEGGDKGILRRANEPRTDSISNLRTRINKLVQEAKNASGEARDALVEKAYDVMRAFCERIVTEDFFRNVVQPYQPNVRMWNLPKIPTNRLGPAIAAIMPIYDKCCRQTAAHAQPLETLSIRASPTECETDWGGVQAIRERYLSGVN